MSHSTPAPTRIDPALPPDTSDHESAERIAIGAVDVDLPRFRVSVDGQPVAVTPTQMRLLVYLMRRQDQVVTRAELLREVWGYNVELPTRTVDIHVQRLRERLSSAAAHLETVRGIGYRFSKDPL